MIKAGFKDFNCNKCIFSNPIGYYGKGSILESNKLKWSFDLGITMPINVKLSENLVAQAKRHAQIQHRSVPKQIEYWSQIGKIAEENPDLPFSMIRDILIADQEESLNEYQFE